MKKTMLALMATVGLAFGAKAVNSTGFESYTDDFAYDKTDEGGTVGDHYWVVTNATPDLGVTVLTAYGVPPAYVPWAFTNKANNTYLKVDTSNEVLYRSVEAVDDVNALNAGTEIGVGGLYFDANVQFTASNAEPDYDSADKLVVWLYNNEDAGTTNLMVTAGVWDNDDGIYKPHDFEIDGTYSADTWYRLTVKAMIDGGLTKFVVYVDDEQLKVGGTAAVFNSLVQTGDNKATLTAVGFKGTGAVDNLVWTTDNPFPVVEPTTVALTVELTDDDGVFNSLTAQVGDAVAAEVNVDNPAPIVAAVDDVITFVAKVYAGYTPTVQGYEVQKSAEPITIDDQDDGYAYTFTVTVDQTMVDDGLTLTIEVTADGGEEVPEEAKVDPAGGSVTVKAANEEVAAAAVTAKGVDGTVYPASQKYYNKTVTPNGDNWDVTVTLNTTALEEDVDAAVAAALEDLDEAEVALPAGFYYMVESGTDVSISTKAYGTSTGAKIEIGGLGENAGFFKVSVDTTSFGE